MDLIKTQSPNYIFKRKSKGYLHWMGDTVKSDFYTEADPIFALKTKNEYELKPIGK